MFSSVATDFGSWTSSEVTYLINMNTVKRKHTFYFAFTLGKYGI